MTRLVLASLLWSSLALTAAAQVKIKVSPKRQKKYEKIHAILENAGSKPITFCIEVGQASPNGREIETTPLPFWIQRHNKGKWSTLMIGPDVGSFKSPEVLNPGISEEFPFRLGDSGQMRLRLNYWNGALAKLDCHAPPKSAKVATSSVFTVE